MSVQRRRENYELCRKYDIIILEDDPYYFLQVRARARGDMTPPPTIPRRWHRHTVRQEVVRRRLSHAQVVVCGALRGTAVRGGQGAQFVLDGRGRSCAAV